MAQGAGTRQAQGTEGFGRGGARIRSDQSATTWEQHLSMSGRALRSLQTVLLALHILVVLGLAVARNNAPVFCEIPGLGVLRGHSLLSAENNSFAAFEGVPYAKPPVGQLRFQAAQPAPPFKDVLHAGYQSNPCPSLNAKGVLVGTEDCLYLSVYTPQVDDDLAMPVLVVLPGDDWTRGYAGRWRPHRLVDRGIVVVTVQSRLGALGFLSTGDEAAPGNLGLKDERLALSWVQQNIRAFGGDPGRVTLSGVGAGAAAAMLHTLAASASPGSGLFQRVIAISGSALSPWALTENTQEAVDVPARQLAAAVGCDCPVPSGSGAPANVTNLAAVNTVVSAVNATAARVMLATSAADGAANVTVPAANATAPTTRPANLTEILECLRTKPVADIVHGTARLQGWAGIPPSPFGPVVERVDGNLTFLRNTPKSLWERQAGSPRVPLLLGLAKSEGLQSLSGGLLNSSVLLAQLDAEWSRLAPPLLAFNATPEANRTLASEQLRRRYLGVLSPADARDGLLRLYGDRHVLVPALRAAILHAEKHPVFVYRFAWSAAQGGSVMGGPDGGSDANVLLMEPLPMEAVRSPAQKAMATDILDLWASFVDSGVPALGNVTAPRVTKDSKGPLTLPFLELVRPGVQRTGNWSVQETLDFWDGLPLLENQEASAPSAIGNPSDLTQPKRSASGSSWHHFHHLLLSALGALAILCQHLAPYESMI